MASNIPKLQLFGILLLGGVIGAVVLYVVFRPEPDPRTRVMCHGEPKFVYKNPELFFPDFVKSMDVSASVDAKLEAAVGSVTGAYKEEVTKLVAEIDTENSMFRALVKAAFVDYNLNPCDPVAIERYRNAQDNMTAYFMQARREKELIAENVQAVAKEPVSPSLPPPVDGTAAPPPAVDTAQLPVGWRALYRPERRTEGLVDPVPAEQLKAFADIRSEKLSLVRKMESAQR